MKSIVPTNQAEAISKTLEKYNEILELSQKLESLEADLKAMKKYNAENFSISWIAAINNCLNSKEQGKHFLRTTGFISNCVASNYGVEVDKSLKNNVASTLSLMFKNKQVGRYSQDKKTYYGLPEYFEKDLETLKQQYYGSILLLAA